MLWKEKRGWREGRREGRKEERRDERGRHRLEGPSKEVFPYYSDDLKERISGQLVEVI